MGQWCVVPRGREICDHVIGAVVLRFVLLQTEVNSAAASEASIFGSICPCIDAVLTDMTYVRRRAVAVAVACAITVGVVSLTVWLSVLHRLPGQVQPGFGWHRVLHHLQVVRRGAQLGLGCQRSEGHAVVLAGTRMSTVTFVTGTVPPPLPVTLCCAVRV